MKHVSKLPHWPPRLPNLFRWFRWQTLTRILLALATTALLTLLVSLHLDYYQNGTILEQFRAGQPAPRDIVAHATINWLDAEATARNQELAARQAPDIFSLDGQAAVATPKALDLLLKRLHTGAGQDTDLPATYQTISPEIIRTAPGIADSDWDHLRQQAHVLLNSTLQALNTKGFTEGELKATLTDSADNQVSNPSYQQLIVAAVRAALLPDVAKDTELTKARVKEDVKAVPPVIRAFHPNEIVIRKGDVLTEDDLRQLKTKQLLTPAPMAHLLPLACIMLFAILALGLYLRHALPTIYNNPRKLLLLCVLIIAVLFCTTMALGGENELLVGLIAIPAGCMAIASLLGLSAAIVATMLLSVIAGLAADHQFTMTLLTMGSALTGIMAISAIWPASRLIPAVAGLIVVNLLLLVSLEAISPGGAFTSIWSEIGLLTRDALAGGLGATIFSVGSIYILARPFGITTHYRLMELSNPNEPLLRRMMTEAPGSYHSSVMVANIAEAAAYAIGADALLTRVAAMYHDIGKLKNPGFFVENQAPLGIENIHQRLTPKLSYLILTTHVKEGVEIARSYKLPEEVINIIREHHGTTLAAYFYHRALSEAGGTDIAEHEFRYPGPKPSSREAAIVMIADSVQASVKSLKQPTPNRIENMVQDIINNRLADGQLEDCDITLRDLRRLSGVLTRILTGLYTYTRIEYPDIKTEGPRSRVNVNSKTAPPTIEPTVTAPGN
jgi:putative nucleotidyltransferase with HDIG domain